MDSSPFLGWAVVTLVSSPFLLLLSLPWLALAWLIWWFGKRIQQPGRVCLTAVPIACGVAPFYGHGVINAYLVALDRSQLGTALVSIVITWLVIVFAAMIVLASKGRLPWQSNRTVDPDARSNGARGSP